MPMCDAYIPTGALDPDAERQLVAKVTDILVAHEVRSITELMDDSGEIDTVIARSKSIAWTFVHRTDTYVAGIAPGAPYYKFAISVPQGVMDDLYIPAINRDIMEALADAEGGGRPELGPRLWVIVTEVADGLWGAHGVGLHLADIVNYSAPGWGQAAVDRWTGRRADEAVNLVGLASSHPATA